MQPLYDVSEILLITLHSKAVACRSNLSLGFKTCLFSKHGTFFNLVLTKMRLLSCSPVLVTEFCPRKAISFQAGLCSAWYQASRFGVLALNPVLRYSDVHCLVPDGRPWHKVFLARHPQPSTLPASLGYCLSISTKPDHFLPNLSARPQWLTAYEECVQGGFIPSHLVQKPGSFKWWWCLLHSTKFYLLFACK